MSKQEVIQDILYKWEFERERLLALPKKIYNNQKRLFKLPEIKKFIEDLKTIQSLHSYSSEKICITADVKPKEMLLGRDEPANNGDL